MSADDDGDESLVRQTLAGNDEAFAVLARRHRDRIARMVSRFAANSQEAEDLLQDIFLRAWRKLGQFRAGVPFEHWLSRLAIRQCYDLLRRRRRQREETLDPTAWETLRIAAVEPPEPAAAREFLDMAFSRLAADERLVLTLLELEERSVRDVAGLTGWSESNVKVRAFRARQKLKKLLEERNGP